MSLIIPANTLASGGYEVANSLRFNDGSTDNLSRTKGTSDSTTKGTYSFWFKLSKTTGLTLIENGTAAADRAIVYIQSDSTLKIFSKIGNSTKLDLGTNRVFRDTSAFYNVVIAIDTTQGTASNRVKLYVNGTQETSFASSTYPDQNDALRFFTSSEIEEIGIDFENGGLFDGYMCEVVKVDGSQLAPTSFGEFDSDSNIWKPIDVSGLTFGTNGFYLDFENSGALGADVSGNTNNFTVNNLTAIDQSTDTCTNNFATMNPLDSSQWQTLSEGNLKIVNSSPASSFGLTKGSIGVTKGKWYWEVKYTYGAAGHFGFFKVSNINIQNEEDINGNLYTVAGTPGNFTGVGFRISGGGDILEIQGNVDTGVDFSSGDTLGLAFDGDSGKLYAFKNGTELTGQNISNGTSLMSAVTMDDIFLPFVSNGDGGSGTKTGTSEFNFGSPAYAISSGNTDGDGYGNFEYAVPSGYYSLNTKNLAEYG